MKRMGLVVVVIVGLAGPAEASRVSDGVDAVWGWMTGPVNAVAILGERLAVCTTGALTEFVQNVLHNANPGRLVP